MKKKSALIALLLAGVMTMGTAAATGCKKHGDGHVHTWTNYTSDGEEGHHRFSTCIDHGTVKEEEEHDYDGDVCTKCEYDKSNGGGGGGGGEEEGPLPDGQAVEVKFMNGSTLVETKSVTKGQKVTAPSLTSDDGTYFGGWYENEACTGSAYNFSTPINAAKTFYAKWVALDAKITYSYAGDECAAFEWADTDASKAKVAYKLSSAAVYTEVDENLIRSGDASTVRVDVVGLKGNETYDFKITTSAGAEMEVNQMPISAYDRSGYAHFNYTDGVGAYNDDGTLKDNALVIYVTEENKNDVTDFVYKNTPNGLVKEDISAYIKPGKPTANGRDLGGETYGSIGYILNNRGYANNNEREQYGIQKLTFTYGGVAVRILGKVSSSTNFDTGEPSLNGLTYYAKAGDLNPITDEEYKKGVSVPNGGTVNDNGNMARITNAKNLTIEGIGEDAQIFGWGVHFVSNDNLHKYQGSGKSFEVRNVTFESYPEDAIGMEGTQGSKVDSTGSITSGASDVNADLISPVERCWIHNNVFNLGYCKQPAESDKSEGDGSCDFKRGQYYTLSYNYFTDCHKTNLIGSGKTSLTFNVSMHHNWWHNVESRQPLARCANIHYYNNYITGATSYVISARANCYIFAEANYFYGSKNISDTGEGGGVVKAYGNTYNGNYGTDISDKVSSRDAKVSNNCKFTFRNIDYSSFDTNPNQFYYKDGKSDCFLEDSVSARKTVMEKAGVMGFGQTNTNINDTTPKSALSVGENGLTVNLAGVGKGGGTVDGVEFTNVTGVSSGTVKGKGQIATFTVAERVDITLKTATAAVLVKSDGTVIADQLTSYTGTLEAGTYVITGGQMAFDGKNSKEATITELSFKCGVSDAERVQNVIGYINDIGTVELTEACKVKLEMAQAAYNALSASLKEQVTNSATLTAAAAQYNGLAAAPVVALISEIGTVTVDSGSAIAAARNAYNALNAAQKALVTNYATLTAAEAAYEKFEVEGINKQIAALAATSSVSGEADITELLEKYQTVKVMYEDLDEDQKAEVVNYSKVTDGIAALQKALKPYEVKAMIAELPAPAATDYYAKVAQLKKAYEALDASGLTLITTDEKAAYDAAIVKYTEYLNTAVSVTFLDGKPSAVIGGKPAATSPVVSTGDKQTSKKTAFKVNAYSTTEELKTGLKLESSTELTLTLETKMTVSFYFLNLNANTVTVSGTAVEMKSVGGDNVATVTLEAGTYKIKRAASENSLYYMTLTPAA